MKVVVFLSMLLLTQVLLTHTNASTEEDFSYLESSPKGPQHWGNLSEDWAACGNGLLQSPIDLAGEKVDRGLGKLYVNYKAANATLLNLGHDIMLQWESDAGYLQIGADQYSLKQIHWHTPSEHQIDGTSYDLEAHMVHISKDAKKAVVAMLYNIGSSSDSFLDKLEDYIDESEDNPNQNLGSVDPNYAINGGLEYYRYMGSLTTPPCTEGVTWTVFNKIGTVSSEQVEELKDAVDKDSKKNARPLQKTNNRLIKLYSPDN